MVGLSHSLNRAPACLHVYELPPVVQQQSRAYTTRENVDHCGGEHGRGVCKSTGSLILSRIINAKGNETTTLPCAVASPQLPCACQPPLSPFAAEASFRTPHLSLWVLLVFLPPSFPLFWGSEDNPRISGSRDRDSEDDLNHQCWTIMVVWWQLANRFSP